MPSHHHPHPHQHSLFGMDVVVHYIKSIDYQLEPWETYNFLVFRGDENCLESIIDLHNHFLISYFTVFLYTENTIVAFHLAINCSE